MTAVEQVALALKAADEKRWKSAPAMGAEAMYLADARAALAAVFDALAEPTWAMRVAGAPRFTNIVYRDGERVLEDTRPDAVWRAMLAAARKEMLP